MGRFKVVRNFLDNRSCSSSTISSYSRNNPFAPKIFASTCDPLLKVPSNISSRRIQTPCSWRQLLCSDCQCLIGNVGRLRCSVDSIDIRALPLLSSVSYSGLVLDHNGHSLGLLKPAGVYVTGWCRLRQLFKFCYNLRFCAYVVTTSCTFECLTGNVSTYIWCIVTSGQT